MFLCDLGWIIIFDIKDKVAIVTWAGSGIGKDAAISYASMGANLALFGRTKSK